MGTVGSAVCINGMLLQVVLNGFEIMSWNQAVGIEYDKIVAAGPFKPIVAAKALPGVFFVVIADVQLFAVSFRYVFAGIFGTIFDD